MFRTIAAILMIGWFTQPVVAQNDVRDIPDIVRVSLLQGWRDDSGRHISALRISLAPGWKTYFRTPGDTGFPPLFNWHGSNNLKSSRVIWPKPNVFNDSTGRSFGYKGDVILPIEFNPTASGNHISTRLRLDFGVCKDVCIPVTANLQTKLRSTNTAQDPVIHAALAQRALAPNEARVKSVTCHVKPSQDGFALEARIDMPRFAGNTEVAVVDIAGGHLWATNVTSRRAGTTLTTRAMISGMDGGVYAISRSDIRIAIIGDTKMVEILGCKAG
jgi:DsbC/DsbD-like thiol-disulfide interchange protein